MQNIHLSAYTSYVNKQKVMVVAHRSFRTSLYCLVPGGILLCVGALVGSYLHLGYFNWQSHRIAISEERPLPYKQSPLHYIYKNRSLPAVSQTSYDDNAHSEYGLSADTLAMENETPEEAQTDVMDEHEIMKLGKENQDLPLEEWLKRATQEQQQQEEKGGK
ncbi:MULTISPECIES: hypothetical protein [Enterobacterales]|uniref:hypothetical protein n=1 Tax=Enterobacterales TaxID=91347 RepID=UPI002EDA39E0